MTGYLMELCFGVLMWLLAMTAADRNYQIIFQRAFVHREAPIAKEYIQINNIKVSKLNKTMRGLNVNILLAQDMDNDVECHIKVFQKIGPKYMKAPVDFPKKPCCQFTEENKSMWACIIQNTDLPETCPLPAGNYTCVDKHPNTCELPEVLPPNTPEEFMAELSLYIKEAELICMRFIVKINKDPINLFG